MATTQMIRTEPTQARPRWTSLSGTILEGGYELQDLLQANDTEAHFKVRVLGDRELECVALMFLLPEAEAERQVELWQGTRALRHPNLRAPMGAGRLPVDGVSAAYVVIRRADESLSAVLSERALSVEETGEALTSVLRALEALHINGLTHGCVSPDVVLAVGDSIQLPAECVRVTGVEPAVETVAAKYLAPESSVMNLTPETDLWCLGATIFEALAQKPWSEQSRDEVEALPEPFATIAWRCLQTDPGTRCTLAEAAALYSGELELTPRVRAASGATIITEDEIAPASAPSTEQPQEAATVSVPVIAETLAHKEPVREQPATRVFVEEPSHAQNLPDTVTASSSETDTNVSKAEAPSPVSSSSAAAQKPEMDVLSSHVIQQPSPAATPKEARTADSSPAYSQAQPTLITKPAWESRTRPVPEDEDRDTKKLWLWAGVALLVVLALVWALRPKHQAPVASPGKTTAETAAKSETASQPAGGQNGSAWQTRTVGPGTAASAGNKTNSNNAGRPVNQTAKAAPPAPAHKTEGPTVNGNVWRVILYTYNREADAEKKVKAIHAGHANLHVEVFSPSGGSPYLVAMAGRMSRDEAAQARRRAIAAGMAHDAYIQNYSK
jgi:serine/threonine protein kinase